MKIKKDFIKFYELENNNYYLFPFDNDLYVATESVLKFKKKFLFFKKDVNLTQGFKMLQLTGPISLLFNEIINMPVDKEDKDFPDMTTYKKVDNLELRKKIESIYKDTLDTEIRHQKEQFDAWKDDFILNNEEITDEEVENIIKVNEQRLERNLIAIKSSNILNTLSFKWKTGENVIIKKMLDNNMEFLYSQDIGSTYKIYYLYDLDIFGTFTIYKVQTVKNTIKSVETFIYNKEIIQELIGCMINNNL